MSSIYRILFVFAVIVCFSITGLSQQGKKSASLDMDDLSPTSRTIETLNAGVSGWATITPEGGRFSVSMPGAVTVNTQTQPSGPGQMIVHSFECELSGRKYHAKYADYIPSADESRAEEGFNAVQSGLVADGLEVLTQNSIKYGTHPGRELIILKGTVKVYQKMYSVGGRFYLLTVEDGNDKKQSEDCKKFMNSFKLIGQ